MEFYVFFGIYIENNINVFSEKTCPVPQTTTVFAQQPLCMPAEAPIAL